MLFRVLDRFRRRFAPRRVELRPWTSAHAGNFDDDAEAYTLFVDGKRTEISFELDESELPSDEITKAEITIPKYVANNGVEIEPGVLADYIDEA